MSESSTSNFPVDPKVNTLAMRIALPATLVSFINNPSNESELALVARTARMLMLNVYLSKGYSRAERTSSVWEVVNLARDSMLCRRPVARAYGIKVGSYVATGVI